MNIADEMKSKYRELGADPELKKDIDKLAADWAQETTELIHNGNVVNTTHAFEDGSTVSTFDVAESLPEQLEAAQ